MLYFRCNCRKADIALIGLAVMGQNLILNMDDKGYVVCAYNRTVDKVSSLNNFNLNSLIILVTKKRVLVTSLITCNFILF